MTTQQKPWIQVWPFDERELNINHSNQRVRLSSDIKNHCDALWAPKAEKGWKSSWIAFADDVSFDKHSIDINCRAIPFHQAINIVNSIGSKTPFTPHGYLNELSVGFLASTKDAKVIFQRRPSDVHCPNTLIHEPCGYMASMNFAPRSECDLEKYAEDPRLFSLKEQLDFRKKEIANTFGIPEKLVSYNPKQDFLACGWMTKEMYFSTIGKINANSNELKIPEGQEIFFVPFENLKDLILNQGELSSINPNGYRPTNPTKIPLIDESLIGLVYGYEQMTGDKLNIPEKIDKLSKTGLEIKVHNTSYGKNYGFPTEFGFSPPTNELKRFTSGANINQIESFSEEDIKYINGFYSRKRNKIEGLNSENLMKTLFNKLSSNFSLSNETHFAITRRRKNPAVYDIEKQGFVTHEGNYIQDYNKTREKVCRGLVNYLCAIMSEKNNSLELEGKSLVKYLK